MNRAQARSRIMNWLAESSESDFFTEDTINELINQEYRQFCADTLAGPMAQFEETGDGSTRDWVLPSELIEIRRVDYGTDKQEVVSASFEEFSVLFGDQYISQSTTGKPHAYATLNGYAIRFHPIPADDVTFRVIGPIVPDEITNDNDPFMISEPDGLTIAKRAYVWAIERDANRSKGADSSMYQRMKKDIDMENRKSIRRNVSKSGGVRVAGSVGDEISWRQISRHGPRVNLSY